MAKTYTKLLEIVMAVLLVCGAWWYSGHVAVERYKAEQLVEQAKANAEQQSRYDKLAGEFETLKTKRESDAKVIVRQVEKVIAGDVVYRNICINSNGLSVANSAITGAPQSIPDAAVQASE